MTYDGEKAKPGRFCRRRADRRRRSGERAVDAQRSRTRCEGNVAPAKSLYEAGCEIIRAAVPDLKSVQLIPALKKAVPVPVVADIHFDYRIALACVEAGVDKIRINPGNIGSDERVKAVADACRAQSIPIRIGVNSGSLEKEILAKHGAPTAQALAESAMYHVRLLEKCDFLRYCDFDQILGCAADGGGI